MNATFSILLPVYKSCFLQECIDSIMTQTYAHWELIIVNDASPESSAIDALIHQYKDKRIQYSTNQQNIGALHVVRQWNLCLSYAKGDYVICMGDDDKLHPHCLATYANLIARYPDVDIFHGQTDIIDENGKVIRHTAIRPEKESAMSLLYGRTYRYHHQFIGDFCFQRKKLQAAGGFYYLPYAWGSDEISSVRAAEEHGIANTKDVVFYYRDNDGSITRHPHTFGKLKATLLEAKWIRNFLLKPVQNTIDKDYQKTLQRYLIRNTLRKCYYIVYHSISSRKA